VRLKKKEKKGAGGEKRGRSITHPFGSGGEREKERGGVCINQFGNEGEEGKSRSPEGKGEEKKLPSLHLKV